LQRTRQARRITLNQAALETRIRQTVLEALEDGDYHMLPPRPFLRGLLRNYALYLNLDPDLVLEEYDVETGVRPPRAPERPPEPPPPSVPPPMAPPLSTDSYPEPIMPRRDEPYAFPTFTIPSTKPNGPVQAPMEEPVETSFQVLEPEPETMEEVAAAAPSKPPTLAQRIGRTRIPEAVAVVAIVVGLFGLVSAGLQSAETISNPFAAVPTVRPTATVTATIPRGSTPTGIPTLPQTLAAPTSAAVLVPTTSLPAPLVTATFTPELSLEIPPPFVPEDAAMTLEARATGELTLWVLVDEQEVFNGPLSNETRTWTAHARLFVQVKNIGQGQVFFQGRRILPRDQEERSELNRAWIMNPLGTPVAVPPTPYPVTAMPTERPTLTPTSTPSSTRTATPTATQTATATSTSTVTMTPSPSPSRTATRTATLEPTSTQTTTSAPTATPAGTATFTPTVTITPTSSSTPAPTETRTPVGGNR